ncbi:hypothetical protein H6786_01830 [Candidatus Nomurabacteria bacterium]|nr:hypothetical protein [Candidatus Nomurabacteria bacterium]
MIRQHTTLHWQRERFPSLYEEHSHQSGVEAATERMKEVVRTAVVTHGLVYEGFTSPYLKLIEAMGKLTEALFELCPDGVVRFELTKEQGIKMLFRTRRSSSGKIFTMIDIGWVYANMVGEASVEDKIEDGLGRGAHALNEVSHSVVSV